MILGLYLSLFLATAWGQSSSPVIDPDKFTICAITINSDDEKKIFQAQAAKYPQKFNPVVELTDLGDDWFSKSCSSGIRCDQLVISGHFGGDFFGESGKSLSLQELEKAGCSKTCEGILNQPYEVFLFGCNTLSGKEKDSRTPDQYLQVLLRDGIPLAQAELVVQSRYGVIGDTHKASMQRAFSGEKKQLYGFDSIGPSGKNVKGFLNNYFSKISSASHLEKQQAKRIMNQVDMGNKILAESLKSTAFAQCAGADDGDEKMKKVCGLLDVRKSNEEKLDLTIELLGQEEFLLYLPAINIFMKDINNQYSLTDSEKASLELIKNNEVIKRQILGLIDVSKGFGLKMEWTILAQNMGYLSQEEASERLSFEVAKVFSKPLADSDVDVMCSIENSSMIKIKNEDLKNTRFDYRALSALSCLSYSTDAPLRNRLINSKISGAYVNDIKMYLALVDSNGDNSEMRIPSDLMQYAKSTMVNPDLDTAEGGIRFMAKFSPKDPQLKIEFNKLLKRAAGDDQKLYLVAETAKSMSIKDTPTLKEIKKLLKQNSGYDSQIIDVLINAKTEDVSMQKEIASIIVDKKVNSYIRERVFNYIKEIKNPDQEVYGYVLDYIKEGYYGAKAFLKDAPLSPELRAEFEKLK